MVSLVHRYFSTHTSRRTSNMLCLFEGLKKEDGWHEVSLVPGLTYSASRPSNRNAGHSALVPVNHTVTGKVCVGFSMCVCVCMGGVSLGCQHVTPNLTFLQGLFAPSCFLKKIIYRIFI